MPTGTHEMQWLYPTPKFALRIVTESLIRKIEQLRDVLVKQQLVNVACLDMEVSWFESVEQSSRLQAQAVMYVSIDKVCFSGRVKPHSEDYFEAHAVLLADIFDTKSSIKSIEYDSLYRRYGHAKFKTNSAFIVINHFVDKHHALDSIKFSGREAIMKTSFSIRRLSSPFISVDGILHYLESFYQTYIWGITLLTEYSNLVKMHTIGKYLIPHRFQ
jgi:hypothetical protein